MLLFLFLLLTAGTIFVDSASSGGEVPFPGALTRNHMVRIAVGLAALLLFLTIDYRRLDSLAPPLYLGGIGMLLYLLAVKLARGGVARWLVLPGFQLQPSEVVKLFTVLLVARMLKPVARPRGKWKPVAPYLVVALPCVLVASQPDLGTALVLPPTLVAMLWVGGVSGRRLLLPIGVALLLMPLGWLFLQDYQKERLLVFVQPDTQELAQGAGYQVKQSITAIGSGGWTGKGLYLGSQNYLEYLPEDHNDFIFGVIGEEWGLLGTMTVVLLYLCLYLSCLGVAYRTREPFGRLVVAGITAQLAFQTIVNLAMTIGLAPVTGLPLPFISFGGSSLLTSLASVGIVLGIGMRPVRMLNPDGLRAGSHGRDRQTPRQAASPKRYQAHR
ncbi:MAG: FtsW/RodA/SpoVE family cell cycle protein [Planctomycetota bacterium]